LTNHQQVCTKNTTLGRFHVGKFLGKPTKDKLLLLLQAVYNHLVIYINKYAAYEQAHLMKKLSTVNCMKEELPDTIQALGLSIPQVIDIARDAKKRCQQITENCGYCGLIIALRAFLLSYADQYRVALRQIDRSKRQEEDWNTFQLCLSLLQNTGEVLVNLHQLEKDVTATILEINQNKDQFEYKYLLLNAADRKEYESLVKCVTEGTQLSLLDHVNTEFNKLCSDIHHTTYQVVFAPISVQLDVVQAPKTWTQFANSTLHNSDLPDYSFSPQEYITQVKNIRNLCKPSNRVCVSDWSVSNDFAATLGTFLIQRQSVSHMCSARNRPRISHRGRC
jgi:hypothetical protein